MKRFMLGLLIVSLSLLISTGAMAQGLEVVKDGTNSNALVLTNKASAGTGGKLDTAWAAFRLDDCVAFMSDSADYNVTMAGDDTAGIGTANSLDTLAFKVAVLNLAKSITTTRNVEDEYYIPLVVVVRTDTASQTTKDKQRDIIVEAAPATLSNRWSNSSGALSVSNYQTIGSYVRAEYVSDATLDTMKTTDGTDVSWFRREIHLPVARGCVIRFRTTSIDTAGTDATYSGSLRVQYMVEALKR